MSRICLLLLVSLVACSVPEKETVYSEDQLSALLIDIHVAKAAIQNALPQTRDSLYDVYFLQICQIHGVDPDSLRMDLDVLTADPDRMEPVYTRVVDSLEQTSLRDRAED